MNLANKLGASAYALWGVIHAYVGGRATLAAASGSPQAALAVLADRAPPTAANLDASVLGLVAQHGFNLLWIGCAATIVAMWLNWRGSRTGYWLNLALVSLADIGFIAFVVLPGHISLGYALPGPVLWLTGIGLTTLGVFATRRPAPVSRTV